MFVPAHVLVSRHRLLRRHISRLICLTVIALESAGLAADPLPSPQPVPEGALLALAQKKFEPLSPAEDELFRIAQWGLAAPALVQYHEESDPAKAANWSAERVVRAECIAWLCTNPQASALVSHSGLQLQGKRIEGKLNLAHADIKFPLAAEKCAFWGDISLRDAQMRGLYLLDCQIKGLTGERAIITGSVFLRGLRAEGEVKLAGTEISGDLDCEGSHFSNAEGPALNANGTKIEGSVYLNHGFKAEDEVNLVGAAIGRDLACDGGQFSNAKGPALTGNGAKINGSIFLSDGFQAEGEVNLVGATIGGDLDCTGGQFSGPRTAASVPNATPAPVLNAGRATIGGGVALRRDFCARGQVNLKMATIGTLAIREILEADQMILDLRLAKVGTFRDDEKSWPKAGDLFLDGFHCDRLYDDAPFEAASRKKWLRLQPPDKFRPQPYEQLASVLREMGHEGEARQVMIEKNREQARFTHFPQQGWWWYNVFGRFIGYGYAPWRAFVASLAMILLGTFLFRGGFRHGLIAPTSDNACAKDSNGQLVRGESGRPKFAETYPVFNAFVYSFESFVPLLKLDQSANWAPNANCGAKISLLPFWAPRTGSLLRGYLYLHIAAGWLLTSLWVGAVSGLAKT